MSNKTSPSYIAAHGNRKRDKPLSIKVHDYLLDGPDSSSSISKRTGIPIRTIDTVLCELLAEGWIERISAEVYGVAYTQSANPLRRRA